MSFSSGDGQLKSWLQVLLTPRRQMNDVPSACTHEDHSALKRDATRAQEETVFVAPQYIDGELLGYLRNCRNCGSTLLLPFTDPGHTVPAGHR